MKVVFEGLCKDCNCGIRKNKKGVILKSGDKKNDKTDYICCTIGGIREPNSDCNMIAAHPVFEPYRGDTMSEFGKHIRRDAIKEYTEIVGLIRALEIKGAGSTGFLFALKEAARDELIEFLGMGEEKK